MVARLDGAPRGDKGLLRKYATLDEKLAARKEQRRLTAQRYREKNAEKVDAQRKEYRAKNADICIERTKKWQAENPDKARNAVYKRKYGISIDDYNRMVAERSGCCDICKQESKLVVDHCHSGGMVRGLLCDRCNVALGCVKDSPEVLRAAAAYLEGVKR